MNDIEHAAIYNFLVWLHEENKDDLTICEFGPGDPDPFPTYLTTQELIEKYKSHQNSKRANEKQGL